MQRLVSFRRHVRARLMALSVLFQGAGSSASEPDFVLQCLRFGVLCLKFLKIGGWLWPSASWPNTAPRARCHKCRCATVIVLQSPR